jgi:hypothetical protein
LSVRVLAQASGYSVGGLNPLYGYLDVLHPLGLESFRLHLALWPKAMCGVYLYGNGVVDSQIYTVLLAERVAYNAGLRMTQLGPRSRKLRGPQALRPLPST